MMAIGLSLLVAPVFTSKPSAVVEVVVAVKVAVHGLEKAEAEAAVVAQ